MKPTEFIKTVFQNTPSECGAACVCMILNYFGMDLTLEDICFKHPVKETGINAGDIVRMANSYGFQVRGYHRELNQITDIPTPAVLHWNYNHFIVLESFDKNYFYINDPAVGRIRIGPEVMNRSFTGVVLLFESKIGTAR